MSGKIINLSDHYNGPQYNKQLGEIENYLGDVIDELRNRAVNLAMVGPWQSYNKDQPEGTRIHIDDEALSDCGDKRVEWMVSLIEMIQDFIEHE